MKNNSTTIYWLVILGIISLVFVVYKIINSEDQSPFQLEDPQDIVLNSYREGYKLFQDSTYGASFQYPENFEIKALSKSVLAVYLEPENPQADPTSYVYISKATKTPETKSDLSGIEISLGEEEEIELPYPSTTPAPSAEISRIVQEGNIIFNIKGGYTTREKTETQIKEIVESFVIIKTTPN